MPMIDVYAPADLFPADADSQLGNELAHAVLSAEGVSSPGAFHLDNTAAFIHRLPASAISTANAGSARNVRIQIITPPGSLSREGREADHQGSDRDRRKDRRRRDPGAAHLGHPFRGRRGWMGHQRHRVRRRGVRRPGGPRRREVGRCRERLALLATSRSSVASAPGATSHGQHYQAMPTTAVPPPAAAVSLSAAGGNGRDCSSSPRAPLSEGESKCPA